ncbi:MAG: ATP-dependent Lhr-like helicase [Planctomycetota bacterium]|jgi:ATP-dependent Lhr-like helicase
MPNPNWRELLPHAFGPFLAQFSSLTEVQIEGIPPIVAGKDVVLCSATASGKTEAYAAPAAQMVRERKSGPASVIIVSPTRALANDLFRRLEGKMDQVGVTFGRRTGEYKKLTNGAFPEILITTPESLDSVIARQPDRLRGTQLVVLDEIHVLDGSARGDQLRILLHRLDSICTTRPQKVAASATVDDPKGLASRYLTDATIVSIPGARSIKVKSFYGRDAEFMVNHLDELAMAELRKILVFCNSRKDVEALSRGVRDKTRFREAIFAHHGSLSKAHRERTERQFLTAPVGVCFATMTLEMGIDIGSVDYVLMVGPPHDVPSLLQRIGRGGRRGDTTRAGYVVDNDIEEFIIRAMFRAGARGSLLTSPYAFRPGVIVQQALVKAGGDVRVSASELQAILPPSVASEFGIRKLEGLLEQLVQQKRLEEGRHGFFVLSQESEAKYDRGSLHSNISEDVTLKVVDRITGDIVGAMDMPHSATVQIAGGNRDVVSMDDKRILTDRSKGPGEAKFVSKGYPGTSFRLARRVIEDLGVAENVVAAYADEGRLVVLHGFGAFGSLLFADQLGKMCGPRNILNVTPYVVQLAIELRELPEISANDGLLFTTAHQKKLEGMASGGPFHKDLPNEIRYASLAEMLGMSEFLEHYAKMKLAIVTADQLERSDIAAGLG